MIVITAVAMRELMAHIVQATHGLTDTAGQTQTMSTISEPQLRMAAVCALQIATGQAIWPGDRPIRIVEQRRANTVVEVERV